MDIRFKYAEMNSAVNAINGYAEEYRTAASTFINAISEATSPWEGASKEKFMTLINGDVQEYIGTTVPEVVAALAEMLSENAKQMKETDDAIAESIPANLG